MLTPTETITFITGVLMCVIGVASFVVGMTSRAKSDGILSNKVDTALNGINEIKRSLSEQKTWREATGIQLEGQRQQLTTLFRWKESVDRDLDELRTKICERG